MKMASKREAVGPSVSVVVLSLILMTVATAVEAVVVPYRVIDLTPPEFRTGDYIVPYDIDGDWQVGRGFSYATGSTFREIVWNGSADSWTIFNPPGFDSVGIGAVSGSQMLGVGAGTATGGDSHAIIWSGSSGAYVDLNPAGCTSSGVGDTNGVQQVGQAKGTATGSEMHAFLWSGSAGSAVDLHPDGFEESKAVAIGDTQQAGWASRVGEPRHAMVWSGTAESAVDLHPTSGLFFRSEVCGAGGDQQVGGGQETGGSDGHAFLWTGTAESMVDLTPAGFDTCWANDTNGSQQVGFGRGDATGGENHALVWYGSSESYIDLHQFLPSEYIRSEAVAIDDAGNIIGYADTAPEFEFGPVSRHVFVWQVPEPASVSLLLFGGLAMLRRR